MDFSHSHSRLVLMAFCFENCSALLWQKLLLRFFFEITRTIHLTSKCTVRTICEAEYVFLTSTDPISTLHIGTIKMPIGTNNWDVGRNQQEQVRKDSLRIIWNEVTWHYNCDFIMIFFGKFFFHITNLTCQTL